ncbi:unnamed protein product [Arctia plantaginis]|uniref:Uncharacterized protein n=1 Tax=Arctia plantaginis TaxID=874455 RepID=A0A8S1BL96_ARCPL|nr:unnamed protein product [Arctia plantaginis]
MVESCLCVVLFVNDIHSSGERRRCGTSSDADEAKSIPVGQNPATATGSVDPEPGTGVPTGIPAAKAAVHNKNDINRVGNI